MAGEGEVGQSGPQYEVGEVDGGWITPLGTGILFKVSPEVV